MSTLFYQKHQDLVNSHFILKQIQSKQYPLIKVKNVFAQLSFFQLDSFQNEKTVETFFILYLLTKQKAWLSYVKKRYKDYHFQFSLNIRNQSISYLLTAWTLFAFPFFRKKNEQILFQQVNSREVIFSKSIYMGYPLIPNIYFSWIKKLSFQIQLSSSSSLVKNCFLGYYLPQSFKKGKK